MPRSLPCGCAESGWLPGGASPSALLTACACAPQVSVPPGALDCWVFLSCLEVLQRIEGCCDRAQIDSNIAHTVGLWSYAMEKVAVECRGSLSGLCPRGGDGVCCWGSAAHAVPPWVALAASGASGGNMDAVGPCQCL